MKPHFKPALLFILAMSFAWLNLQAQPKPKMTSTYSNEEIDSLLNAFRPGYADEVSPNMLLEMKFNHDFPSARKADWETNSGIYEVYFKVGKKNYEAYYDTKGNLLMYSFRISKSALPSAVTNAIATQYPAYQIDDVEQVMKGIQQLYMVELEQGENEIGVLCKEDGTLKPAYYYEIMGQNLKRKVPVK